MARVYAAKTKAQLYSGSKLQNQDATHSKTAYWQTLIVEAIQIFKEEEIYKIFK